MRRFALVILALPLLAQTPTKRPPMRSFNRAEGAEMAVKNAAEQLAYDRKTIERDIEVLAHLRGADNALVDNMQPSVAVQKAYEEVIAAKRLNPEFNVMQGVIKTERELEGARRSPMTADFGHLRAVLREQALGPASHVVVRNALRLEEEAAAWLKVQGMIAEHLKTISDLSSQSLRASERE